MSFSGVLIFSKLLSGMWPHFDLVGERCGQVYEDFKARKDIKKYQTTGTEDKKMGSGKKMRDTMRDTSPLKTQPTEVLKPLE